MRVRFPGTRGNIKIASQMHRRHAVLALSERDRTLAIDLGEDWLGRAHEIAPAALLVSHAHPDHAGGLARGAPFPVYATEDSWRVMHRYPVAERHVIEPLRPFEAAGFRVTAYALQHSLRAPAVGYRIETEGGSVFYAPDVAAIPDAPDALKDLSLYVGDGASPSRPILKRRGDVLTGHAPIATQLDWCRDSVVPVAIFSHCGSQIVRAPHEEVAARVRAMGDERGVTAMLAYDGFETLLLPPEPEAQV